MASLPNLPEPNFPDLPDPWVFTCERDGCGEPIALWSPAVAPEGFQSPSEGTNTHGFFGPIRPTVCPDCAIELAQADRRDSVLSALLNLWDERQQIGRPPGTLIGFELPVENAPLMLYGLGVEAWPESLPQLAIPWNVPGCPPRIALFSIWGAVRQWSVGPKFMKRWSWESLESPAWYQFMPPTPHALPTRAEWNALWVSLSRIEWLAPSPTGRLPLAINAERYVDLFEEFIKERERPPHSWEEFAAFVGEKPSTLRDRFQKPEVGLWPWRDFKRAYFSEQVIRRVLACKAQGFS